MEYQQIINKMPRYPILEAEIRKSPLSFDEIAKQAHISPARLRAHLKGKSKAGSEIRLFEGMALKEVMGCKSLDGLFYTPEKQISRQMEESIEAVAVVLRDDLGYEAMDKAMEPLGQYERYQVGLFFISLLEYAADIWDGIRDREEQLA